MSPAEHHHRRSRTEPRRTFSTTLPVAVLHELEEAADETGLTKSAILTQALTGWIKEYKQARLAESYRSGMKV